MKRRCKTRHGNYRLMLILRFILVFNILSLPMYAVMYFELSSSQLQEFVASLSSLLLAAVGHPNTLNGHEILVTQPEGMRSIDVSWDSTGWKSLYAMFSLIMATPLVRPGTKLRYIAAFLPAVFAVNIFRIVTTISIAITYGFSYFDFVHLFLWRWLLIATILALWAVYFVKEKDIMIKA